MKYLLSLLFVFFTICCCKKTPKTDPAVPDEILKPMPSNVPFRDYLGINLFEWDYVEPNQQNMISERKMNLIKAFGGIRHYLDWGKIEVTEGNYTFNPSHAGGWYYDLMYQRTKAEGIEILACLKTIPPWLMNTYPESERDIENVPAPYGLDRSDPTSYIKQAKAAFQFAARYGSNKNVDQNLVTVNPNIRWPQDEPNTVKIGLDLVKYIECDNERDKWWKGKQAEQTAEEYAANLSAFYDGNKGKLGKNVGVKNADPNMKVVISGLSIPDPNFVIKMIEWCRKNRGLKTDGTVDLCFDIINYHVYPNDSNYTRTSISTTGVAPELTLIGKIADDFLEMAKSHTNNMEVWVTETGYDVNTKTIQRAIAIGEKTAYITQADWNLRTALLYARHGIKRCMFYMLDDVDINSSTQYTSSGFVNADFTARPSLNYMRQTKKLLGDFKYSTTLNNNPIVDLYKKDDKEIYVLTIPDQKGRTAKYNLNLGSAQKAIIYTLQPNQSEMTTQTVNTNNGKLEITVTETPVFVEKI